MTRSKETILLVVLTALGAAVRGFRLGAQSLWLDELFSVLLAQGEVAAIIAGTVQDTMPPLYYLLLRVALQFGSDEVAARAMSFGFSVATLPLLYFFARSLFNRPVALIATVALALNPFQVFYAQEARMYAQLGFFTLAAFFFFYRAWRTGGARDWMWCALMLTLAFYTHSLAFLNLLALDLFALTQRSVLRERWRALGVMHIVVALLFAPWVVVLAQQAMRVQAGFWGVPPSPLVFIATPYLFLFSNTAPVMLVPFALFAALALMVFALFAARRAIRVRPEAPAVAFALCVGIAPLGVLFLISLARPLFVERALIASSFGWYLLLAWAVVCAPPRVLNRVFGAVSVIVMVAALTNYFFNAEAQKPPMREAARAVAAQFQPGDVVAHTSDSSALAFMYYAPQLPNRFLAGDPDYVSETTRGRSGRVAGLVPEELDAVVAGHLRVWLVVALDHNIEYQKERVAEFDRALERQKQETIGGIDVILWTR